MVPSLEAPLLTFDEAQQAQECSLLFAPLVIKIENLRNIIEGEEVALEIIPLGMSRRVKDAAMTMATAVEHGIDGASVPTALGVAHGLGVAAALGAAPVLGVNAFVPGAAVDAHSVAPGMHFMGGSFLAQSLRSPRASIARRESLVPSPPLSPVSASFA
ncbi:uncharacterized protein SCHCODRAFT_02637689 [Schizophyllum commune H4-8]|uniref:Uncharacterized protein n=1 Tax=Schizophyllum commune (strain H4-8 / FGSC 9210) TaxID=578458 RepID=D8QDC3_SCHCM|nr:uncharacterized protein SCHCODRAFT_02637689 [Schizophyllum commune H4-8]KAI5888780.1 hypothetical protein SCHCODRAFT_02637689 [Schizophyllum commune H4-8]